MLPGASREHSWDFCWPGAFAELPACAAHSSLGKGACALHAGGSAAPGLSSTENEPEQHSVVPQPLVLLALSSSDFPEVIYLPLESIRIPY